MAKRTEIEKGLCYLKKLFTKANAAIAKQFYVHNLITTLGTRISILNQCNHKTNHVISPFYDHFY